MRHSPYQPGRGGGGGGGVKGRGKANLPLLMTVPEYEHCRRYDYILKYILKYQIVLKQKMIFNFSDRIM